MEVAPFSLSTSYVPSNTRELPSITTATFCWYQPWRFLLPPTQKTLFYTPLLSTDSRVSLLLSFWICLSLCTHTRWYVPIRNECQKNAIDNSRGVFSVLESELLGCSSGYHYQIHVCQSRAEIKGEEHVTSVNLTQITHVHQSSCQVISPLKMREVRSPSLSGPNTTPPPGHRYRLYLVLSRRCTWKYLHAPKTEFTLVGVGLQDLNKTCCDVMY